MERMFILAALVLSMVGTVSAREAYRAGVTKAQQGHDNLAKKALSKTPFQVSIWAGLGSRSKPAASIDSALDLSTARTENVVEEITVYETRRAYAKETTASQPAYLLFGPATIAGGELHEGNFAGMGVTAAIPIGGVPGLDAIFNLSGGHDQINASTTTATAAATVGLRLRW